MDGEDDQVIKDSAYQQWLKAASWKEANGGSADLAKTNESLAKIREELEALRDKYLPPLAKAASSLRKLKEEVVDESTKGTGELSVAAQYLIEQDLERAETDLRDLVSDHRSVHTAISKSGKDIDRYLGKNLSGLFKGQKDLEEPEKGLRDYTSQLICKHIHTSGYIKSSAALVKDAGLTGPLEELPADRMDIETLTGYLKEHNLAGLTEWVMRNEENNFVLLSDLDKLKVVKMIKKGERAQAIQYCKKMRTRVDSDREFEGIYKAAFVLKDSKVYENSKLDPLYDDLQKRIMYALTYEQCLLPYLLHIGIQSIPNLMHIRQHIDKRPDFMFSGEEFPMALSSECDGHCTVNCPILRQQVTKENPAVRISCGHVMSKDAVTKLSAQSRGVNRIKCPYCPSESTLEQAQDLLF
ncbi:hypothetical protein PENTCL1PPCAC_28408 [Pristionchus entomophagus]|uniref:RING-Gid-type domain-containing protein n=1 Tax=Pristionchus entomophagus TaxID=358040 RepID=A0AAV5UJX3_9BILA|nr:hypothetical protein PENTCL1PPCAC_28408 [Pristionchus entomophagus]